MPALRRQQSYICTCTNTHTCESSSALKFLSLLKERKKKREERKKDRQINILFRTQKYGQSRSIRTRCSCCVLFCSLTDAVVATPVDQLSPSWFNFIQQASMHMTSYFLQVFNLKVEQTHTWRGSDNGGRMTVFSMVCITIFHNSCKIN